LAKGETKFGQTDAPGIYTVNAGGVAARFAVNLDPADSRTGPLPLERLEGMGVPLREQGSQPKAAAEQKRRLHDAEMEGQQKIWRWLTLVALAVLLVETWLGGWATRRPTPVEV